MLACEDRAASPGGGHILVPLGAWGWLPLLGLLQALPVGLADSEWKVPGPFGSGLGCGEGLRAPAPWLLTLGSAWAPGSWRAGLASLAPEQRWEGSPNSRPRGLSDVTGAGDMSGCRSISGLWVFLGGGRRLSGQECGICRGGWAGVLPGDSSVAGSRWLRLGARKRGV